MPVLLGLLDLVPALLILLVMGAVILLIGLIKTAVDQIPGGSLVQPVKNGINNAANNMISAMTRGMANVVRPIGNLWAVFANWADRVLTETINTIEAHASVITYVLRTAIPAAVSLLQRQISAVEAFLDTRINQVLSALTAEIGAVERYLLGFIASKVTALLGLISSVQNFLLGRLAAVQGFLMGSLQVVQAILTGNIAAAVAMLTQRMLGLNADTAAHAAQEAAAAQQNAIAAATQWAAGYTNNAVAGLDQALNAAGALGIAGALPDFRALGKELTDVLPGELAGILPQLGELENVDATSIASAIGALSIAGVTSLEGLAKCSFPLCDKVGKFGDEMASLMDGAILALMIAFVAAAVEAPEPTAKAVDTYLIEPLATVGSDVIGFLTSL